MSEYVEKLIFYGDLSIEKHGFLNNEISRSLFLFRKNYQLNEKIVNVDTLSRQNYNFGSPNVKCFLIERMASVLPRTFQAKEFEEKREILELVRYYWKFSAEFARRTEPLLDLLKHGRTFYWGKEQQRSFEDMKGAFTNVPILQFPDFKQPFIFTTGVSDFAMGREREYLAVVE